MILKRNNNELLVTLKLLERIGFRHYNAAPEYNLKKQQINTIVNSLKLKAHAGEKNEEH